MLGDTPVADKTNNSFTGEDPTMETLRSGSDALFILLGAIMVLAMHAGFAFLELGTVRSKNQVNALVKILSDFAISTVAYFCVGYGIAYGVSFFVLKGNSSRTRLHSLCRTAWNSFP